MDIRSSLKRKMWKRIIESSAMCILYFDEENWRSCAELSKLSQDDSERLARKRSQKVAIKRQIVKAIEKRNSISYAPSISHCHAFCWP